MAENHLKENRAEDVLQERRECRRKRRKRNQTIVYLTTAVVLIGIAAGAVFGIKKIADEISARRQAAEELQRQEEEQAAAEETPPVIVEAPEEYEEEPAAEEKSPLDNVVDTCIAELPLEDKVAGLFYITPEELTGTSKVIKAGDTTKAKLLEYAVGGLIYSKENIKSGEQLREMLTNTVNMSKYPIFLGVEEEGGKRAAVAAKGLGKKTDSMEAIGQTGNSGTAYEAAAAVGAYLGELGFNMNFAPVADTVSSEQNKLLEGRAFGAESGLVADMVSSAVRGFRDAGLYSCLKHFPGVGYATNDPAEGMTVLENTLEDIRAGNLIPFKAGMEAGAEFVMVSHLSLPNLAGDNTPLSLSSAVITDILRGELGYEGIVITDALDKTAITEYYTSEEACIKALQAGADMLLKPENFAEAYEGVLEAVKNGTISEERIDESLRRIYRVKYAKQVAE